MSIENQFFKYYLIKLDFFDRLLSKHLETVKIIICKIIFLIKI